MEQRYKNYDTEAIEAVYKFPLDSNAVLKSFTVEIDGRTINGEVRAWFARSTFPLKGQEVT